MVIDVKDVDVAKAYVPDDNNNDDDNNDDDGGGGNDTDRGNSSRNSNRC